jgi:hypothetical protein
MAAPCCLRTAANCGWRRSKPATPAVTRCAGSSAGGRCGLSSKTAKAKNSTAMAGCWLSLMPVMPSNPYNRPCWSKAWRGCRPGGKACDEALLTAERAARAAHRGLWADPNLAPLQVENLAKLTAEQGRFAPVEGKVLSVRENGATIYMSISGGAGRGISPSPYLNADSGHSSQRAWSQSSLKDAPFACADGSNGAASRSSWPKHASKSSL